MLSATTPATHLYHGARVTVAAEDRALRPAELALLFSDGTRTPAELLRGDNSRWVLEVAAYMTAAGTAIPAKRWAVTGWSPVTGGISAKIGQRLR